MPKETLNRKDNDSPLDGNPYRNLWARVIQQAVDDLSSPKKYDSGYWFFTSNQSNFEWICKEMGFNAQQIRNKLLGGIWYV